MEVNRRDQELMQTYGYVTAAKLKDAYLSIGVRTQGTCRRYRTVCSYIREFLPHTYKREDILLKELNLTFINDFEYSPESVDRGYLT